MPPLNPFRNPTKEEQKKQEVERKEIEARIKTLATSAKNILSSDTAIKYREDLDKTTKAIIRAMIRNTETDPVKFYCAMKAYLLKLDAHYTLLEEIENDAK